MIEIDLLAKQDQLRVKVEEGKRYLFDPIRRKWLVLQPEELVRQLMVLYLVDELQYSKNRINVETGLLVKLRFDKLQKRSDILVYDDQMQPFLLVECKSHNVEINQEVFKQAAIYNLRLKVPYLLVTNGRVSYCCRVDYDNKSFEFVSEIPAAT